MVRCGGSRRSRRGKSWSGMAGYVKAVEVGCGSASEVAVSQGMAVKAWPGQVGCGKAVEVRRGLVRRGMVWRSINLILTREEYYNGKF